jgi:hypothetical protein
MQQKEELLVQSKQKNTTLDSVKLQIDTLMKVCSLSEYLYASFLSSFPGRHGHPEEG